MLHIPVSEPLFFPIYSPNSAFLVTKHTILHPDNLQLHLSSVLNSQTLSSHHCHVSESVTALHDFYSSFSALSLYQSTFYSLWLATVKGKPTSSSWNFPEHQKGSQERAFQPEHCKHTRRAVYRKWTASLLYLASIKGNSAEDFLEGVMKLTHTHIH